MTANGLQNYETEEEDCKTENFSLLMRYDGNNLVKFLGNGNYCCITAANIDAKEKKIPILYRYNSLVSGKFVA